MTAPADDFDFADAMRVAQLKMRQTAPFFATLALFAGVRAVTFVATAATDGKDLFFNPTFVRALTPAQRTGLLLHETLHAALLHLPRRGGREARLWNIAADIVVNGIILDIQGMALPEGAVIVPDLVHLSVEEIYHRLAQDPFWIEYAEVFGGEVLDLREGDGDSVGDTGQLGERRRQELTAHWRDARAQAEALRLGAGQGNRPAGLDREYEALRTAQIDWRAYLWRFLVQTPTDFRDFDRRLISRGYYLETLAGDSVTVAVAVDTSGSVDSPTITAFLSEVQGLLASYPHLRCDLYYADAKLYGPFELAANAPLPPPVGGGGTSFIPFFEALRDRERANDAPSACVYLTDGFGRFPLAPPTLPVLWVINRAGMALDEVPFGEAVRLVDV